MHIRDLWRDLQEAKGKGGLVGALHAIAAAYKQMRQLAQTLEQVHTQIGPYLQDAQVRKDYDQVLAAYDRMDRMIRALKIPTGNK